MKFGLDVAGGFLGPAWPLIRPVVEHVLEDLPKEIAGRYKSSQEAADEALAELEKDQKQLAIIESALEKHGISPAWLEGVLAQLDQLTDDMFKVVAVTSRHTEQLDDILALITEQSARKPGRLVLRGERLEYVDYVQVGESFQAGFDLAPGTVVKESFPGRHMPSGFFIWNFMLLNDGQQLVTVSSMEMKVVGEYPFPEGATRGSILPLIEAFEDDIWLAPGAKSYPLFRGKMFKYAPEADVDAFRIRAVFQDATDLIQQVQLVIHWKDGTGDHEAYGTALFLASLANPQLHVSH
jgi:hypothetical protein